MFPPILGNVEPALGDEAIRSAGQVCPVSTSIVTVCIDGRKLVTPGSGDEGTRNPKNTFLTSANASVNVPHASEDACRICVPAYSV